MFLISCGRAAGSNNASVASMCAKLARACFARASRSVIRPPISARFWIRALMMIEVAIPYMVWKSAVRDYGFRFAFAP